MFLVLNLFSKGRVRGCNISALLHVCNCETRPYAMPVLVLSHARLLQNLPRIFLDRRLNSAAASPTLETAGMSGESGGSG